jgi:hypothetical protein
MLVTHITDARCIKMGQHIHNISRFYMRICPETFQDTFPTFVTRNGLQQYMNLLPEKKELPLIIKAQLLSTLV